MRANFAPSPYRFFDRCISTGRALKLISYDFSSNFYIEHITSKIFLFSRIICPVSTTVAYCGIVDSLLHDLSFRNLM